MAEITRLSFGFTVTNCNECDRVEVVRCRDCIYNRRNREVAPLDITDNTDITCTYFMTDGMDGYDYCSRAKKRGETNDSN